MSPAKDDQHSRRVINGPRPSPLRINKDSNAIQKSSSSYLHPSSSFVSAVVPAPKQRADHQQRKPVIIYTHSPKIIHTQARDFMALVQKLTGLSQTDGGESAQNENQKKNQTSLLGGEIINDVKPVIHDDNESSSVVTDEKYGSGDIRETTSSISPIFRTPNPYFADIPLFTPNSSDFFSSSRPLFRYSDMVSPSPNMPNSLSPSFLEVMKGLPEY